MISCLQISQNCWSSNNSPILCSNWPVHTLGNFKVNCFVLLSRTQSTDNSVPQSHRESGSSTRRDQIRFLQKRLFISVVGFTADLGMAINWAPSGVLWAGKLSIGSVGLLGTISSLCELYKYFRPTSAMPDEALGSIWCYMTQCTLITQNTKHFAIT